MKTIKTSKVYQTNSHANFVCLLGLVNSNETAVKGSKVLQVLKKLKYD